MLVGLGYGLSTDIWSLGVMVFEMVGGCSPFRAREDQTKHVISKQRSRQKVVDQRRQVRMLRNNQKNKKRRRRGDEEEEEDDENNRMEDEKKIKRDIIFKNISHFSNNHSLRDELFETLSQLIISNQDHHHQQEQEEGNERNEFNQDFEQEEIQECVLLVRSLLCPRERERITAQEGSSFSWMRRYS